MRNCGFACAQGVARQIPSIGIHDANISLIVTTVTAKRGEIVKASTDTSGHTLHRSSLFKVKEANNTPDPKSP